MWTYERSTETEARVAAIWKLYSDVRTWPWWDLGIQNVEMPAAFAAGSTGRIILADKTVVPFQLQTVVPMQTFIYLATHPALPAPCESSHVLRVSGNQRTRITHKVTIMGVLPHELDSWTDAFSQRMDEAMESLAFQALSDA
jgi:hypothetical protein